MGQVSLTPIRKDRGFSWFEDGILIFRMEQKSAKPTTESLYHMNQGTSRNRGMWLLLGLLAVVSFSLFFIPAFVIRPFRHQSQSALNVAIDVRRVAPTLALVALTCILALAWLLWRSSSKLARTGIVFAMLLSTVSAVMVRQNYFEWMFQPVKAAGFVSPGDARLDDKEMVMTVQVGTDQRAYPIVQMAYHHILNDTVAGEPLVVTY
jgi:hypothetical protein